VGKNNSDKEAYNNFLRSKFSLDKTVEEPINLAKTNSSSFKEENKEEETTIKKSLRLKIKDFFGKSFWISVVTVIIGLVITGIISTIIWSATMAEKIQNMEKEISSISQDNREINEDIKSLDKAFNVFKVEVSKDVEFIKKILKF